MIKAFEEMEKIGKKPVIAQIGGFNPEDKIISSFGGGFRLSSVLDWPKNDNGNMLPVIQIAINELPVEIPYFNDIKLIQVFIDSKKLPVNTPCVNGNFWLIKFYNNIEGLNKVNTPDDVNKYKEFQIKWSLGNFDYPCWEEAWDYIDLTEVNDNEDLCDEFKDKYWHYTKTKIGGYAAYIQSPSLDECDFVMQIASEEKPGFMIADNGRFYIGFNSKDNNWYLSWDCY